MPLHGHNGKFFPWELLRDTCNQTKFNNQRSRNSRKRKQNQWWSRRLKISNYNIILKNTWRYWGRKKNQTNFICCLDWAHAKILDQLKKCQVELGGIAYKKANFAVGINQFTPQTAKFAWYPITKVLFFAIGHYNDHNINLSDLMRESRRYPFCLPMKWGPYVRFSSSSCQEQKQCSSCRCH